MSDRPEQIRKTWEQAVGMNKAGRKMRMRRLADAIVAEWSATAATEGKMKSTLQAYKRSIHIREVTETSCTVELPGQNMDSTPNVAMMARMIEFGMGPGGIGTSGRYDIRDFLLKGKTARNVPFKSNTKMIQELGQLKNGGPGGQNTMNAAKALGATTVRGGSWVGPKMAAGFTRIMSNPHSKGQAGSQHATDRLHGLRKMRGKDGKTSRYITFRRASSSQGAGKWIHPGIEARHLAAKVMRKVPEIWRTLV
jgi:hypothetical protein